MYVNKIRKNLNCFLCEFQFFFFDTVIYDLYTRYVKVFNCYKRNGSGNESLIFNNVRQN